MPIVVDEEFAYANVIAIQVDARVGHAATWTEEIPVYIVVVHTR